MARSYPLYKRLGSRGSNLALTQSRLVQQALRVCYPDMKIDIEPIATTGDKIQDRTLIELGGKGLFVKEIEEALLEKRIDFAVHSLKDMPPDLPEGLIIGAILKREDPRDVLIAPKFGTFDRLPKGCVLGTASLRRQAQIKMLRPDILVEPLRGNVETRIQKIKEGHAAATILAMAGLKRLGLEEWIKGVFSCDDMLPAVGQGALCVECRADDDEMLNLLAKLDHFPSRIAIIAERACLRVLEGSCRTPIAAYGICEENHIHLRALIAKSDGSVFFRTQQSAPLEEAEQLGRLVGEELRAQGGPGFFAIET